MRKDWVVSHQYVCQNNAGKQTPTPGGKKNKNLKLSALEVKHLENQTPFLKIGKIMPADATRDEKALANI